MRPVVVLLLFALPALAAPVPKAVKAKAHQSPVGEWVLVKFSMNGVEPAPPKGMALDWLVDEAIIYPGTRAEMARNGNFAPNFTVRDPDRPNLRMWGGNPAVYEVDGDTLRVCYASDGRKELTECKPDQGIAYYVLERVKGK